MTEPYDVFPPSENDCDRPFRDIAQRLKCDIWDYDSCWEGLTYPIWSNPEHYQQMRDATSAYNKAARSAINLFDAMKSLSSNDRDSLFNAGLVTLPQIRKLAERLESNALQMTEEQKVDGRQSNRNIAAHNIGISIHRLFQKLGKPITWGITDGGPSTDYGRAVEYALAAFNIKADWRRPAQSARDTYLQEISSAMLRNQPD